LIYIPLPDKPSRMQVFKAVLRKSPIAPNISFDFLAELTDGFTGADLTELCQRSTKAAIREAIEAEEQRKALMKENPDGDQQMADMEDPVPVITRKHFEEALAAARKSVTAYDLDKFEQFRKKYDPAYAAKVAGATSIKINWHEDSSSQFQQNAADDDDLYS
jgi:transitional endoplasmic reticulum ATPase